ncbi:podocalyxin isoform 2-T2 [Rhynochetos jubatus]
MRAVLLLLLLLLLLGVSFQDVTTTSASPGKNGQIRPTTSQMPATTHTNILGNSPSNSVTTPAQSRGANPTSKTVSPTTTVGTTTTGKLENPPSSTAVSHATVQRSTSTNNPSKLSPTPMTSSPQSQQVSSSASSATSTTTSPATSSMAQQKTNTPSLGSLKATTSVNPSPTHARSPPATTGHLETTATCPHSVKAQASQSSDKLASTAASTEVPTSSPSPVLKGIVSSPTAVTKPSHTSSSSPIQGLASYTRPGSISTPVAPFNGSVSTTTSKASLSLPSGSTNKVSEASTTPTLRSVDPDQKSHGVESVQTTPASADQSPASAQPSAPAPGDQTASSIPGLQHPNFSFQNEVICKDQVQNNWPTIYLKEAKTCGEWKTASVNISFFESFCSTGQHAFNASRETCTVMLTSQEPSSQHWAVWAVVHLPLDPEKVLKELKEKDKLEELGIANITYDKMEREMIINDEFSTPLIITIITLAGSLLLIAAIYGCCHQRFSQKKDQHIHPDLPGFDDGHVALIFNRLTEELQTMENGYHDNPTLEVMETSSEMQEKKMNLNGELGDSWIVPLDTLMKEDLEEEEDTHL